MSVSEAGSKNEPSEKSESEFFCCSPVLTVQEEYDALKSLRTDPQQARVAAELVNKLWKRFLLSPQFICGQVRPQCELLLRNAQAGDVSHTSLSDDAFHATLSVVRRARCGSDFPEEVDSCANKVGVSKLGRRRTYGTE